MSYGFGTYYNKDGASNTTNGRRRECIIILLDLHNRFAYPYHAFSELRKFRRLAIEEKIVDLQ